MTELFVVPWWAWTALPVPLTLGVIAATLLVSIGASLWSTRNQPAVPDETASAATTSTPP